MKSYEDKVHRRSIEGSFRSHRKSQIFIFAEGGIADLATPEF